MTVEANTAEYVDLGDGVTTVFPFPSRFMSNDDITVALDGVVVTTGFSITGAGTPSGGNVTFSLAPADGVKVARLRDPAIRQLVDFAGVSGLVNRGNRNKPALHMGDRFEWLRKLKDALT